MKELLHLFFIIFISCVSVKQDEFLLDDKLISKAYISQGRYAPMELNKKEIKKLVDLVNESYITRNHRFTSEYKIIIQFKNDSTLELQTWENTFKLNQIKPDTYSIPENNYFSDLWNRKSLNL